MSSANGTRRTTVLVVGESWIKHTIHMKGFDQFHSTEYEEGAGVFLDALRERGIEVDYLRAHEISAGFPTELEQLEHYDAVILSDVGSNSFLLTDDTFLRSARGVNRLELLAEYVRRGGGLMMVGGYMSFTGIDGRARFGMSPLADVLPVTMLDFDDRVERPEGVEPTVVEPGHDIVAGIDSALPALLGYNRVVAKADSSVVVGVGADPLLVVGRAGQGRTVAFTSDLAPHWAPPEFLGWEHYGSFWAGLVEWVGAGRLADAGREIG